MRGQKEKFTLNSAARTLRIRAHSNEHSHPCYPVNIFFRASVCLFFSTTSGRSEEYAKRSSTLSTLPSTHHSFFFLFFFTQHPLTSLSSLPRPFLPASNPAESSSKLCRILIRRHRERRGKQNQTRGNPLLAKKKGLRSFFFAHFLVRVASLTVSRLPSHFDPRFWFLHSLSYSSVRRSSAFLWDIFYARFDEALEPFDLEPVFHVTIAGTAKTNEHLRNFP